jgi:hypothetical protein
MLFFANGIKLLLCASMILVGSGLHAAVITEQTPVTVNLGHGANVSYLVFDESSLSSAPVIYAWRYDGLTKSSGARWSGSDLFDGVIADSLSTEYPLRYSFINTSWGEQISGFSIGATSYTYLSDTPVWAYWIKGGSEFVPYGNEGVEFTFEPSPLSWVVSPSNYATRWLSNGSYDGWTLSPFSFGGDDSDTSYYTDINGISQPVTIGTYYGGAPLSAVPEPGTVPLLVLAGVSLFLFLRRRSAAQQ